jgi:hypothetical protein
LTDYELEVIEVVNSKIEVSLSNWRASATGDKELAWIIDRIWARPRQTSAPTRSRGRAVWIEQVLAAALLVAAGLTIPVLAWLWDQSLRWSWTLPILVVVIIAGRAVVKKRTGRWDSYAVIVPMTLDEYRKDQTAGKRQLITWLIATSAIAATLLGMLIGVLIKL